MAEYVKANGRLAVLKGKSRIAGQRRFLIRYADDGKMAEVPDSEITERNVTERPPPVEYGSCSKCGMMSEKGKILRCDKSDCIKAVVE